MWETCHATHSQTHVRIQPWGCSALPEDDAFCPVTGMEATHFQKLQTDLPWGHCPGGMRRYTELHSLHRDPESKCTIQYCSRQPLMGGEDKTSVNCWQHHISHHLLGLDTHFFFPELWVLLCAATHTEKFHSNFTTSRSHFSFYPPYSCEVQLQSHNSQDTEIFSKILGCSTVLLWLHSKVPYAISMPAECHCIFFKHQGKRMPALATQVCHVLNIKLTDRTRDWDSALLELQDSP